VEIETEIWVKRHLLQRGKHARGIFNLILPHCCNTAYAGGTSSGFIILPFGDMVVDQDGYSLQMVL